MDGRSTMDDGRRMQLKHDVHCGGSTKTALLRLPAYLPNTKACLAPNSGFTQCPLSARSVPAQCPLSARYSAR